MTFPRFCRDFLFSFYCGDESVHIHKCETYSPGAISSATSSSRVHVRSLW